MRGFATTTTTTTNKTLVPKFKGWLWIFNRLVRVFFFPPFYSI